MRHCGLDLGLSSNPIASRSRTSRRRIQGVAVPSGVDAPIEHLRGQSGLLTFLWPLSNVWPSPDLNLTSSSPPEASFHSISCFPFVLSDQILFCFFSAFSNLYFFRLWEIIAQVTSTATSRPRCPRRGAITREFSYIPVSRLTREESSWDAKAHLCTHGPITRSRCPSGGVGCYPSARLSLWCSCSRH